MLRGMWDPPGPGIEPMSLALAGGFFTAGAPRKTSVATFGEVFPVRTAFHTWALSLFHVVSTWGKLRLALPAPSSGHRGLHHSAAAVSDL